MLPGVPGFPGGTRFLPGETKVHPRIPPGSPGGPRYAQRFHRGSKDAPREVQGQPQDAPGCSPGVQGPSTVPRGRRADPDEIPCTRDYHPLVPGEAWGSPGGMLPGPPGGCKGKNYPFVNFYFPNGVFERKSPILPLVFHGFDLPRLLILFHRAISPHKSPLFPTVSPGGKGGCTYGQYPTGTPGGPLRGRHSIASGFRGVPRGFPVQPVPFPGCPGPAPHRHPRVLP